MDPNFEFTQELEIDQIKQLADYVGKTNKEWNVYDTLLKWADVYTENGLTPVVLLDIPTQGMVVTSRECLDSKLH